MRCAQTTTSRSAAKLARWTALSALVLLPLAGCDDDSATAPNGQEEGTMQAVIQDNGASGVPSAVAPQETSGEVSGQFAAEARVEVMVDGAWQQVSDLADLNAQAELQGGSSTMGSATVEARTYERVRIVVSNAEADIEAGSDIGLGPIQVDLTLAIGGGGDIVVEHPQPVTVQAGATTQLVLDLNSSAWLDENAVQAGAVSSASFQSAAQILVQ
jgi:hypothetical protein